LSSSSPSVFAIERLWVQFPDRVDPALEDVCLDIEPGDAVALTGPSGCGKSTLLRAMVGFIPGLIQAEVRGDIRIKGQLLRDADPAEIASHVGLVQQDPEAQICTLRVRQEVAFGPENLCLPVDEVNGRVDAALEAVGITHLAERDTTTLSGGEKQRLAIASILAMDPSVVLLDEPTANLDPDGALTVFEVLSRLREQERRTLLICEHRLGPLLPMEPRLIVVDKGQIVHRRRMRRREDLFELGLRAQWALAPRASAGAAASVAPVVVRDVSFDYGLGSLLDDLSFSMEAGTVLGVIGPNGGGKTTLLRLLAGLESPRSGEIVRPETHRIGMVFQHPHQQIFERTVRRELAIDGFLSEADETRLLQHAGLAGLHAAAPLSLSLGEQRRLTVMAVLRRAPDLVLLDEPFIGQDRNNVAWIVASILAARDRGAIVVLVSHDIDLVASLSDQVIYLDRDPVVGAPEDVFSRLCEREKEAYAPGYWDGGAS